VGRRALIAAALCACVLASGACGARTGAFSDADTAAIERAVLRTLFVEREGARQLVIFRGVRRDAPALSALPGAEQSRDSLALVVPDTALLALGVPLTIVTLADIEAHFRANPDGWEAWFKRYAGAGGIVELTAPRAEDANGRAAWLVVGRACGEHCRAAWRVRVARDASGAWRTTTTTTIALPRS
jgi:hypothetical protein